MTPQHTQAIVEQLWLTYYNDALFAKGVISEEQRNQMRLRIHCRTASAKQEKRTVK